MIAIAKFGGPTAQREDFNEQFLEMLPKIRRQAKIAFRGRTPEVLEELIEEVVASVFAPLCNWSVGEKQPWRTQRR